MEAARRALAEKDAALRDGANDRDGADRGTSDGTVDRAGDGSGDGSDGKSGNGSGIGRGDGTAGKTDKDENDEDREKGNDADDKKKRRLRTGPLVPETVKGKIVACGKKSNRKIIYTVFYMSLLQKLPQKRVNTSVALEA